MPTQTRKQLPGWMYSSGEPDDLVTSSPEIDSNPPLIHLLPRLKEYLAIVDPSRSDRALELLVNAQTEDELFRDLQAQYGVLDATQVEQQDRVGEQPAAVITPESGAVDRARAKVSIDSSERRVLHTRVKAKRDEKDDEMSDFIVSDSEDDDSAEDEDEESEFEEDSDIDEPEPDEDLPKRRRLSPKSPPSTGPPPSRPPVATRLPPGPAVICKYGKACYRRNPVHFQEFAHPWLLNPPS